MKLSRKLNRAHKLPVSKYSKMNGKISLRKSKLDIKVT